MNTENLKTLLRPLRDLIMSNRVAYKDYIGTGPVEIPGKLIATGTLSDSGGEMNVVDESLARLVAGKTYRVKVGDETWDAEAIELDSAVIVASFDIAAAESPDDAWMISYFASGPTLACMAPVTYVGQHITLSTVPETKVQKQYKVKKLAYELLPDKIVSLADSAYSQANSAYRHTLGNRQTLTSPTITPETKNTTIQSEWVSRASAVSLVEGKWYALSWSWGGGTLKRTEDYYQYRTDLTAEQTGSEDITCGFYVFKKLLHSQLHSGLEMAKNLVILHDTTTDCLAVRVTPLNTVTINDVYQPISIDITMVSKYSNIAPMTLPIATFHSPGAVNASSNPGVSQTTPVAIDTNGYMWVDTQNITLVSSGSGKKFKLLVDDSGTLSTQEVTAEVEASADVALQSFANDDSANGDYAVLEYEGDIE